MIPRRIGDEWFVFRGVEEIAGPFHKKADAWRRIDPQTGEPISRSEKTAEWV
ncbi:hypothetical protein G6L33_15665 [Agrobacterium rhizogenes]|nr:hypothetical protein [Rhizobium rhizogenes]